MANIALYGFANLQHRMQDRVTEIGVDDVMEAISQSLAEHNRQIDALTGLFVEPTTDFKTQFRTAKHYTLQPLDSSGRALPIAQAGHYDVSWPIKEAGLARGENYITGVRQTLGELAGDIQTIMEADARWMRKMILAALYNNAAWSFKDTDHGTLTISPLANGDAVTYNVRNGDDQNLTDTHYLAQAGAIADGATTNPYAIACEELLEHPENEGATIYALIPTNLKATTRALTDFYEEADPNLRYGQDTTRLGLVPGTTVPGEIIGYVGGGTTKVWVCEWRTMPNDYIIHVAVGGSKPLRMRQYSEAELRGFRMIATRSDFPYSESQWRRWCGFGAWNRVGATVTRVGNASYAIPSGYTEPVWG